MAIHEYRWRDFFNFFRVSRVAIDDERRTITLENCMRSKSFWNLFPLASVTCSKSDVTELKTFTQEGHRCLQIETSKAKVILLDSDIRGFDDLVTQVRDVSGRPSEGD